MRFFPVSIVVVILYVLAAFAPAADKEEEIAIGHLLYLNAVGEKGWSFFVLDGEDIRPGGIECGYRSAWVSYPPGKRKLQFEHQPLGLVDLEADLKPGGFHAFICYSDFKPQVERGRPPQPVMAVKELRCDLIDSREKAAGNHMVLINLTPTSNMRVRVGKDTYDVPRLVEKVVKVTRGGGQENIDVLPSEGLPEQAKVDSDAVQVNSDEVATVVSEETAVLTLSLNFEDAGNRFIVFYMGAENTVQSVVFDDVGM